MRVGLLPLGRSTFDVPFAERTLAAMLSVLDARGCECVGPRALLLDAAAAEAALGDLAGAGIDRLLILQVTFTDAAMTMRAARALPETPLSIWAPPEPRTGGRLRLNALCGLNLASHALGRAGRDFGWLHAPPGGAGQAVAALLAGERQAGRRAPRLPAAAPDDALAGRLAGRRIGCVGTHPDGFDTCAYDADRLRALTGVEVDAIPLSDLFDAARAQDAGEAAALRARVAGALDGLAQVDQDALDRSLRLKLALDHIRAARDLDAFAIRCWPETFTEYGGAVCGAVSMLGEARTPCACEADVHGAVTQMALQEVAGAAVFLVDLVDMDPDDDTGVVWHCGQAPVSMAADRPRATVHANRKMPLLYEFALKPGLVTFARLSQAHGAPSMAIARGEMLARPRPFAGTSGVVRFARPAAAVLADLIASGLEHHMALAYGDHVAALEGLAAALDLPVLEL